MQPTTMYEPLGIEDWPDHMGLPDKDDSIVHNHHEHSQSNILTESFHPRLCELHPNSNFLVAADMGIYFDYTDPVLDGCRSPDWYYVPGVPGMLKGRSRRSYVLWKEHIRPTIVIEYVSGDGREERDRTPGAGKFWIYERVIAAGYYVIFDPWQRTLEVFAQNGDGYHAVALNEAGRFLVKGLNLELGIWDGLYLLIDAPWLRVWDPATGKMLSLAEERSKLSEERTKVAVERAEAAEMGLEEAQSILVEQVSDLAVKDKRIETVEKRAESEAQRADEQQKRAESEHQRADEQQKRAESERQRADEQQKLRESERQRADEQQKLRVAERQRADALAAKLRALGIDPDS